MTNPYNPDTTKREYEFRADVMRRSIAIVEPDSDAFEKFRLIGVSQGLVHALGAMTQVRAQAEREYRRIPANHTRKSAAKLAEIKTLDTVIDLVDKQLRRVQKKLQPENHHD